MISVAGADTAPETAGAGLGSQIGNECRSLGAFALVAPFSSDNLGGSPIPCSA
jgi:hypothetical protein